MWLGTSNTAQADWRWPDRELNCAHSLASLKPLQQKTAAWPYCLIKAELMTCTVANDFAQLFSRFCRTVSGIAADAPLASALAQTIQPC